MPRKTFETGLTQVTDGIVPSNNYPTLTVDKEMLSIEPSSSPLIRQHLTGFLLVQAGLSWQQVGFLHRRFGIIMEFFISYVRTVTPNSRI
jgi:hypothetical protein